MTIKDLALGQSATILQVGGQGALRQHFLDMGVIPGAVVTLEKFAPMGDPMELRIHSYSLTLRLDDGEQITVSPCEPHAATEHDGRGSRKWGQHSHQRDGGAAGHPGGF